MVVLSLIISIVAVTAAVTANVRLGYVIEYLERKHHEAATVRLTNNDGL